MRKEDRGQIFREKERERDGEGGMEKEEERVRYVYARVYRVFPGKARLPLRGLLSGFECLFAVSRERRREEERGE